MLAPTVPAMLSRLHMEISCHTLAMRSILPSKRSPVPAPGGRAMMTKVAAFAVLSLIVTVTPGPDSLLVLRSSLLRGRRAGARVAAGAASGSLAWGLFSAAGLTALLAASAQLYRAVQLAGACYLVFLGIRGW